MKNRVLPSSPFARATRAVPLLALALSALPAAAQNELSNFTATGRGGVANTFVTGYQAIGINPANVGRSDGATVSFTLGEFGAGLISRTASRKTYDKFLFDTEQRFKFRNEGGKEERRAVAKEFTGNDVANAAVDFTPIAISYYSPEFGGLAISTRYRALGHVDLSSDAAQIIFMGNDADIFNRAGNPPLPTISTALAGSRIQLQSVQEFNIAYGRQVIKNDMLELYAGVGYKYIRGIGILDLNADNGKLSAYGALSPVFDASYPDYIIKNADFNYKSKEGSSAKFPSVGAGSGLEFGLSATVAEKLRLALSVVDLGTMTWKANLLEISDQRLQRFGNFSDGTFYDGPTNYNLWKALKPFNLSGDTARSPLTFNKIGGKREVKLPSKLRGGIGYTINDQFEVGFDYLLPFDKEVAGAYKTGLAGFGIDYKPLSWLKLSSGVTGGGGYGFGLPLGISFSSASYEAGFATRDVPGLFADKNPYLSLAMGFLRFKIGTPNNRM